FQYTAEGPKGLLTGKKVYVLATRGGNYQGTSVDVQTGYVRLFLSFIGITDVEFVYAEGLALGDTHKAQALEKANAAILELAA
ncbi:NAD(P)H-dependent oxidoreductase, partial [Candidatus Thiothrix sp. Deng01]